MARGTSGASEREAFWRGHVAAWQGSGESIRGYCRRRGLSKSSFHAWRRVLGQRDAQASGVSSASFVEVMTSGASVLDGLPTSNAASVPVHSSASAGVSLANATSGLTNLSALNQSCIPVESRVSNSALRSNNVSLSNASSLSASASASFAALEVALSSGRVVRVHRGFDEATLAALVRVLEAGAC